MRTTKDLTLKDDGDFVLLEFSEEIPMLMSKLGMGSMIVNYYRKVDKKDEYVPQFDLGEPFILDSSDPEPLCGMSRIQPGEVYQTLHNNLIKAPIFKHQPYSTDFLVIRSTVGSETKYYIREIKNLFVVGQTYPLQVVPVFRSRVVNAALRDKMRYVVYRVWEKTGEKYGMESIERRIKQSSVERYFPNLTETQLKARVKAALGNEQFFYRRSGSSGSWYPRPELSYPIYTDLLKLSGNSPEFQCIFEATQVGRRHLLDLGYTENLVSEEKSERQLKKEEKEGGERNEEFDLERALAPWELTKNFESVSKGGGMLRVHGEGDPTGRGEGMSFLKVNMKEAYVPYPRMEGDEDYDLVNELQKKPKGKEWSAKNQSELFNLEIARVWKSQAIALADPYEPELTEMDEIRFKNGSSRGERSGSVGETPASLGGGGGTPMNNGRAGGWGTGVNSPGMGMSPAPGAGGNGFDDVAGGAGASRNAPTKFLKIRRLVTQKDGTERWEEEVIKDPAVIKVYQRERKKAETDALKEMDLDELVLTDDPVVNAERLRLIKQKIEETVVRMQRKKKRTKKGGGEGEDVGTPDGGGADTPAEGVPGTSKKKGKGNTTCKACGQQGHNRLSKLCPKYVPPPDGTVKPKKKKLSMASAASSANTPKAEDAASPGTPTSFGIGIGLMG